MKFTTILSIALATAVAANQLQGQAQPLPVKDNIIQAETSYMPATNKAIKVSCSRNKGKVEVSFFPLPSFS